jgi:hypothetical protein
MFSFCANHPQAVFTAFFNTGILPLGVTLLEDLQDPSWRHYFYLCIRCLEDLYICFPVFRDVAKAF